MIKLTKFIKYLNFKPTYQFFFLFKSKFICSWNSNDFLLDKNIYKNIQVIKKPSLFFSYGNEIRVIQERWKYTNI